MPRTQHFIVSGRVQGVGFRAATCDTARALELAGWVRNRADGTVEVLAAGNDRALERLHEWLSDGPPAAQVDRVVANPAEQTPTLPAPFATR